MGNYNDLSKSRFFSVKNGTIFVTDQTGTEDDATERLPSGIIDQKYQIIGLIGEGGMGAVFRARHLMLNKDVALKTFKSAHLSEDARLRFQREAQAIAKLNHKNVVQVFDFGLSEDGVPYYTMEYLLGESLEDRIKKTGPLPATEAIKLFRQICEGLSLAHSKGIIHRDLKPANLFIESNITTRGKVDSVKIVDFGIASLTNQSSEGQKLTTSGTVFGSPLYMSPEQSMGKPITQSADVYSMGCTFFEALCGIPPFVGANALETIMMHESAKIPTLKQASGGKEYSAGLEQAVAKMLAKTPADRQSNMDQVAAELAKLMPGRKTGTDKKVPPPAKPAPLTANSTSHSISTQARPPAAAENQEELESSRKENIGLPLIIAAALLVAGVTTFLYFYSQTGQKPAAQKSAQYRKIEQGPDGKTYVVFNFPLDLKLGVFRDSQFVEGEVQPVGSVKWLADKPPQFEPSAAFLQDPENIAVFEPNDLLTLDFKKGRPTEINTALMKQVARLTGLKQLDLEASDITASDLRALKGLSHLTGISLNDTNIDGETLAKMPQLNQLTAIYFNHCSGAGNLIAALKNSHSLTALTLDNDKLKAVDFKTIGQISSLTALQLNDTDMSSADLLSLTPLTNLRTLQAKGFRINKDGLAALKQMRHNGLVHIKLSSTGLTNYDMEYIRRLIPNAEFIIPPAIDYEELTRATKQGHH